MYKFIPIIGASAILTLSAAVSCNKQEAAEPGRTVSLDLVVDGNAATKTWLGEISDGVYPVWWSDGDRVSVNGVTSTPISVPDGQKLSKATFLARNVDAPFNVLYPVEDVTDFNAEEAVFDIAIPASQAYTPGSFSCGSAILYGRSENETDPVELKNLCGAVKLTLKDDAAVIKSLVLTSLGEQPVAGSFKLDVKTGSLQPVEGVKTITVTLPEEGVALTSEGTSFIITIPSGSYPEGFSLRFEDNTKHILRNYWLRPSAGAAAGVEVKGGDIVVFSASAYDPDAREITCAEDWEEFAAACNAGDWESEWLGKDGTVRITEDFSATSLTKVDNFGSVLDAGGHKITQTAGKGPLFGTLTGTVKNLTLEGGMIPSDPGNTGAVAFVSILQGGTVEGCTNKMSIVSKTDKKTVGAAFVRSFKGGLVKDCVNEGVISLDVDVNSTNQPFCGGGIVATVPELTMPATISGCVNRGLLTFKVTKNASSANRSVHTGFGGIVGSVVAGDATKFLVIENCENLADVNASYSVSPTSNSGLLSGVGGIVGLVSKLNTNGSTMWWWVSTKPSSPVADLDCVYAEIRNCVNRGNIWNDLSSSCSSDDPYKGAAGGVAGVLNGTSANHILVDGCKTYGKVVAHENKYSRSALGSLAGGLCGIVTYADFNNCTVKSEQVGSSKRQNYSSVAALGYVTASFKMTGCSIYAKVNHIRTTTYTDLNYGLGFCLSTKVASSGGLHYNFVKLDGSEISNCRFGGSLTYNSSLVSYNSSTTKLDKTDVLTASSFSDWIAAPSFYVDADGKHFDTKLTLSNNTYWDGNE